MISTDAFQVGFLSQLTIVNEKSSLTIVNEWSSLTIVNEGSSSTIVNETTSFIKNEHFKKRSFLTTIVSFQIFWRLFHNETIVIKKMKTLTSLFVHDNILYRQGAVVHELNTPTGSNFTLRLVIFSVRTRQFIQNQTISWFYLISGIF